MREFHSEHECLKNWKLASETSADRKRKSPYIERWGYPETDSLSDGVVQGCKAINTPSFADWLARNDASDWPIKTDVTADRLDGVYTAVRLLKDWLSLSLDQK